MRASHIGRTMKARRIRTNAFWFCLFAGALALATTTGPELREVHAQSSLPQATSLQDLISPAIDPNAQAHLVESAAKQQEAHVAAAPPPTDPQQKQIYDDGASLLKLASTLKVEVDKTSADTLSLMVIRRADEIEKLAHKMRTK